MCAYTQRAVPDAAEPTRVASIDTTNMSRSKDDTGTTRYHLTGTP
ncbi:MAG: hypothetical protein ACM3Q0_04525 [Bacteroidota bacterium]